jgi:hypothetical protein
MVGVGHIDVNSGRPPMGPLMALTVARIVAA